MIQITLILAALAVLAPHAPQLDRSEKLSLAQQVEIPASVSSFGVSPDGTWLAYIASGVLYAKSGAGIVPVSTAGQKVESFEITPDSSRVVYCVLPSSSAPGALYTTDGSAPPVRLAGPPLRSATSGPAFRLTPDGTRAVYRAHPLVSGFSYLISVASDASSPEVFLSPNDVNNFQLTPDSSRAVALGYLTSGSQENLLVMPCDGSAPARVLNDPLGASQSIASDYRFTADGTRVVYRTQGAGTSKVLSVRVDVVATPVELAAVGVSFVTTQSGRVLVTADVDGDSRFEVYSVPSDGSAAPLRLDGDVGSSFSPSESPDGTWVAFRATIGPDHTELFRVPSTGGVPLRLTTFPPPAPRAFQEVRPDYVITPDSALVVFRIGSQFGPSSLHSVLADGSGAVQLLSGGENVTYVQLAAQGDRALFLAGAVGAQRVLHSVRVDGTSPSTRLSQVSAVGGSPKADVQCIGQTVLFRGDERVRLRDELQSVSILGGTPEVVSGGHPASVVVPSVGTFAVAPDEEWVAYVEGRAQPSLPLAVRSVPLASSGGVRLLSAGVAEPSSVAFSPDSTHVYFFGRGAEQDLFSAPVDGSSPPSTLTAGVSLYTPVSITRSASGSHVIAAWTNMVAGGNLYRYFRPDGSGPVLSSSASPNFSPDSTWVVYWWTSFANDLLGNPTAGGDSYDLAPGYDVGSGGFSVRDDGVVFVGAPENESPNLLYRVVFPGGVTPQLLSLPGAPVVGVLLTSDRDTAVYLAYASGTFASSTWYRVPVDGSAAPTVIGGPVTLGGVAYVPNGLPKFTPDGLRLVYVASSSQGSLELFSVLLDGSEPPTKLTSTPPFRSVNDYLLCEDGSRAVYRSDAEGFNRFNVYSVPVDGSAPAVKLSGTLVSGGSVGLTVQLAPRMDGVVYIADAVVDQRDELWFAPLDGSRPPHRVNGPLQPSGDVSLFSLGRNHVYYTADQELDGTVELYRFPLPHRPHQILR